MKPFGAGTWVHGEVLLSPQHHEDPVGTVGEGRPQGAPDYPGVSDCCGTTAPRCVQSVDSKAAHPFIGSRSFIGS